MPKLFLCVSSGVGEGAVRGVCTGDFGGIWLERGAISIDGAPLPGSISGFLQRGAQFEVKPSAKARWVRFEVSATQQEGAFQRTKEVDVPERALLLRLDEVRFPPGAVAYRHVHPGPGFRILASGALKIIGDHRRETAHSGHIWFEAANSPVRAEASCTEPLTSFVRFMVLPVAFEGQATIQILDRAEAALPRLQVTHRHLDMVVQLSSG